MRPFHKWATAGVAALLTTGGAYVAWAQSPGMPAGQTERQIARVMGDHKMTLGKAIDAAEQKVKGEAISAVTQMQGGDKAVVIVTVIEGETTHRLSVEVDTGNVVEAKLAPANHLASGHAAGKPQPSRK